MRNNTDRKSQRTTVGQKARQADHLAWSEDPPFLRELYSLFPKVVTPTLQNNTFTQQYLKQLDEAGCFDDLEVANVFLVNSVAAVSLVWQPCADDGENRFNFLLKTIWYSPQHYPPLSRGTHFVSEGDTRDIVATSLSVAVWLDVTRLSADVKTNPSLMWGSF
ncbi:hypothetical protein SFRURICE_001823 [Spodoptera frugiperda]|nr:hypothetical protein SFRURICE_001823 [Spodoptera frugiperda]